MKEKFTNTEEVVFNLAVDVTFKINKDFLTEELMDAYEECIHDVNNDSDFDHLETREDKHLANIACCLARGETNFIEGYGEVSSFIDTNDVTIFEVEKE